MMKRGLTINRFAVAVFLGAAIFFALGGVSVGALDPVEENCEAVVLTDPSPALPTYNSSIAYYRGQLLYSGNDGWIYAYNTDSGLSIPVADVSALGAFFGVAGLCVAGDYLYFTDNGTVGDMAYRIYLNTGWPTTYESLDTDALGYSIFAFTQNPWTGEVWFCSSDFPPGNMYLYRITGDFSGASQVAAFAQPHSGGNGPIIFRNADELLYGESVFYGDGYFHLIDTDTGAVTQYDYLQFSGGLSSAAYDHDLDIYVATGSGGEIYLVDGSAMTLVAGADPGPWGLAYGDLCLYVADQIPYSPDDPDAGKTGFNSLCCYDLPIPTLSQYGMAALLILLAGAALFALRRRGQVG